MIWQTNEKFNIFLEIFFITDIQYCHLEFSKNSNTSNEIAPNSRNFYEKMYFQSSYRLNCKINNNITTMVVSNCFKLQLAFKNIILHC